jgi:hypothetical protein
VGFHLVLIELKFTSTDGLGSVTQTLPADLYDPDSPNDVWSRQLMLARYRGLISLILVAALAACSDGDGDPDSALAAVVEDIPSATGLIEIIHASQDAPPVNILAGGSEVVGDLDYRQAAYLEVEAGDYPVEVQGIVPAGDAIVIPAQGEEIPVLALGPDQRITVIAVNEVASIEPVVLIDDQPSVAADEVRLRVVHAASIAQAVEVWLSEPGLDLTAPGNGTLINAVFDFKDELTVDPLVVPAGDYQVRVSAPGDPGAPFYDSGTISLPGGTDLVIAAVVNTGPGDSPIALVASTGEVLLEFNDAATPADVRVVHASADAPAVDVLVNDSIRAVEGAIYEAVTEYIPLVPDSYNFKVVPAQGGPGDAVIDADVVLSQGSETTIAAVGTLTNPEIPIEPLILVDDNRRITTEAKLRLVHASVSAGEVDIFVAPGGSLTTVIDPAAEYLFTAQDIPFKAETGYLSLPAGSYDIAITAAGDTAVAIGPLTVEISAGGIYTALARDAQGIGLPLSVTLLDDFVTP